MTTQIRRDFDFDAPTGDLFAITTGEKTASGRHKDTLAFKRGKAETLLACLRDHGADVLIHELTLYLGASATPVPTPAPTPAPTPVHKGMDPAKALALHAAQSAANAGIPKGTTVSAETTHKGSQYRRLSNGTVQTFVTPRDGKSPHWRKANAVILPVLTWDDAKPSPAPASTPPVKAAAPTPPPAPAPAPTPTVQPTPTPAPTVKRYAKGEITLLSRDGLLLTATIYSDGTVEAIDSENRDYTGTAKAFPAPVAKVA